ncbi:hypothetical protein LOK49_LG02G00971 [Camellia lanceoleosa]|uniref:Uncharacterized protein n=1 Tax=Camellia lanceoleosa TaxID=1840588 RepID=A0ACC0IPH4_9ERIC|nr:hypothetical protein LOK49_LG02G00971 [Camellia lanceoleosa]
MSRAKDVVDLARHYGQCYWELSKARLNLLVVATSGTGYILGSGNAIDYVGLCCACAGTMMVAASANSLNQFKRLKLQRNNWDSDTYEFDEVLTKFALQKRVYEVVAKPVIEVLRLELEKRLGEEDTADRGIIVHAMEDILAN